jgi:hypothetical protein
VAARQQWLRGEPVAWPQSPEPQGQPQPVWPPRAELEPRAEPEPEVWEQPPKEPRAELRQPEQQV